MIMQSKHLIYFKVWPGTPLIYCPDDSSRVLLQADRNKGQSDYINASYVQVRGREREREKERGKYRERGESQSERELACSDLWTL